MTNKDAIQYQTHKINDQIGKTNVNNTTYKARSNYQMTMYNSVKYVNQILLAIYIILFGVIHLLLIVQYLQGIKRNELADTIWLFVFFLYPYLIYYIEKTIYFAITYPLSFLYGKSYVYQFDQILMMTDFYKDPGEAEADWKAGSVPVDVTESPANNDIPDAVVPTEPAPTSIQPN